MEQGVKRVIVLAVPIAAAILAIAEGRAEVRDGADAGRRDASAGIPPDPPPLDERYQWVFDLRWDRGEPYLLEVRRVDSGGPRPTPRVMGRFALELFEGPTLIERVRFDFPMLGADPIDAGARPRLEPKLKTRIGVLFPDTRRGTRLELWDRAQNRRWPLPWPPREGAAIETDAGTGIARP